jgi:hypothetical protein
VVRLQNIAKSGVFAPNLSATRTIKEVKTMTTTKFVVRVNRTGARGPEYVQRIDRTPIQTTPNRKLALIMGRFTAEDTAKSLQTVRCTPELLSVSVNA